MREYARLTDDHLTKNNGRTQFYATRSHKSESALVLAILIMLMSWGCDRDQLATNATSTAAPMTTSASNRPSNDQEDERVDRLDAQAMASCTYVNPFSSAEECKSYYGSSWTLEQAESDCIRQPESRFGMDGPCMVDPYLGRCYLNEGQGDAVAVSFPGESIDDCAMTEQGCTFFAGGRFEASEICIGQTGLIDYDGIGSGGVVFQPFEFICAEDNPERCMWQAIGGCAPEGDRFLDYAACGSVLTQRPYVPVPPSGFETPDGDPILDDREHLADVEWARQQAESCGCVCCHTSSVAPRGAAVWDTEAAGLWTDTFTPRGLAQAAGWLDTSSLGGFPKEDNNGFSREVSVLPTTDIERMVNLFARELSRRGYTREDFADEGPVGGPLYRQLTFEPSECELGEGINLDQEVYWGPSRARYIYILDEGSANPGAPPNLDLPEGVLWRLDVDYRRSGLRSGITYGSAPPQTAQAVPVDEVPPALIEGRRYYLYVLQDISIPIARCLFTYGEVETGLGGTWGDVCRGDEDCDAPSEFCAKMPSEERGYCTAHCSGLADCQQFPLDEGWSCNAVNCSTEALTWCGPQSEIEESGGFLSACP